MVPEPGPSSNLTFGPIRYPGVAFVPLGFPLPHISGQLQAGRGTVLTIPEADLAGQGRYPAAIPKKIPSFSLLAPISN